MNITEELITPAQAGNLLKKNTTNRPLRPALVGMYASDMAAGQWPLAMESK